MSEPAPDKKSTPPHQRGPLGHHRLNGHESEQTPGDGEGQGSLVLQSTGSQSHTQLSDSTTGVVVTKWSLGDISGKTPTDT